MQKLSVYRLRVGHENFDFIFSISFPRSPEYSLGVILNFYKNSLWYSQLCEYRRWWIIAGKNVWNGCNNISLPSPQCKQQPNSISKKMGKLQHFSYLSPVSSTPLINLYFRISPQIFLKIWKVPNGIFRGPGETIHEQNLKPKMLRFWKKRCILTIGGRR